jgi:hypothetical protein
VTLKEGELTGHQALVGQGAPVARTANFPFQDYGFVPIKYLGAGNEGRVYLIQTANGAPAILKAFHRYWISEVNPPSASPNAAHGLPALRHYEQSIGQPEFDLYPITLLTNERGVIGLTYSYEPLIELNLPVRWMPGVRRTLLAAFWHSESALMRHGLARLGPQYMLTPAGEFRYTDYGKMMCRLDTPLVPLAYALDFRLFYFIYETYYPRWLAHFEYKEFGYVPDDFSMDQPSRFADAEALMYITRQEPLLRPALARLRVALAGQLADPDLYRELAEGLDLALSPSQARLARWGARLRTPSIFSKLSRKQRQKAEWLRVHEAEVPFQVSS